MLFLLRSVDVIHFPLWPDELTPREKDVILLRCGLDGDEPRTLEEVGRS